MAGSYKHVVDKHGRLLHNENFSDMIENLGDAYEAVVEMYGMIWYLADQLSRERGGFNADYVGEAVDHYREGLDHSPGFAPFTDPEEGRNDG